MSIFSLPTKWVFVEYESGKKKCVANQDYLSKTGAEAAKQMWDKKNDKVCKVTLESDSEHGDILRTFEF